MGGSRCGGPGGVRGAGAGRGRRRAAVLVLRPPPPVPPPRGRPRRCRPPPARPGAAPPAPVPPPPSGRHAAAAAAGARGPLRAPLRSRRPPDPPRPGAQFQVWGGAPGARRPPSPPHRPRAASPALPAPGRPGHRLRGTRPAGHGCALPGGHHPRRPRPRPPGARAAPAGAHLRLDGVLGLPAPPAPGPLGGRRAGTGRSPAKRPHPGAAGAAGERGGPLRPRPPHRLPARGPAPGPAPARRLLPAGAADLRVHRTAGAGRGARRGQHAQGALRLPAPDVAFFDVNRTGQLVNRLTADIQEFKSSFKLAISQGLRSGTQTVGCFVSLYLLSPKLTGLLVVALPVLVGAGALIGAVLRSLSRRAQEQVAKATTVADEVLGNVRTVRAFAMEDRQAGLYCAEVDRAGGLNERLGLGIAAFQGLSNLALNGIVLGTIFVGGSLMAGDELSPGDLMSFLVASQTVQRSMANISILLGQVVRGLSAGARVFELLTLEPSVALRGGGSIPTHSLLGRICFHRVSFSYPSRPGYPVLRDFTLTLPPCKTVAIVGPSGGGKSTVAALLERFYEPTQGTITLDGHDISSLDPSWLRGQVIGFISQEPVLFGTTIMENIRFGKPGASDAEVHAAAQLANADSFIRSFPEGYDTVVGERGVALSGGQKQRIAIARALLKDPAVLILDEATSALDAQSEQVVQETLDRAAAGRTVLLIAHRLSTIQGADLIVVLARGRVAEAGTHEELVRRGGLYAELIRRQTKDRS